MSIIETGKFKIKMNNKYITERKISKFQKIQKPKNRKMNTQNNTLMRLILSTHWVDKLILTELSSSETNESSVSALFCLFAIPKFFLVFFAILHYGMVNGDFSIKCLVVQCTRERATFFQIKRKYRGLLKFCSMTKNL